MLTSYHYINIVTSGDEAFRKGMHSYLSKYSYKNALTPQLWAELEAASGLPVTSVMKTWTEQVKDKVYDLRRYFWLRYDLKESQCPSPFGILV